MGTKQAKIFAKEIGEAMFEEGLAISSIQRYGHCYTWWTDIVSELGVIPAVQHASLGWISAEDKREA